MEDHARSPTGIRFDPFELFVETGELLKDGRRLKLSGQPIQVLACLLATPGQLVTREQLQVRLWPGNSYGDFEKGLNAAVNRLREYLGDSATDPKYIETVPGRGYRFIGKIETSPSEEEVVASSPEDKRQPKSKRWLWATVALAVLATAAGAAYWFLRPRTPVVTAFQQLTRSGRQKTEGSGMGRIVDVETDGTRVYFQERDEGKWHIAQVSTKGGDVSYVDTPLLTYPWMFDMSKDGSELLVEDIDFSSIDSPFWVLPLPNGPARRITGVFSWVQFLSGTNQIVYQQSSDPKRVFAAKLDGSDAHSLMSLPGEAGEYFTLSPDGQRARFTTRDGKAWESKLDGSEMHRFVVPEFTAPACCAYWSGNDRLFVFAGLEKGVWNLWAVTQSAWPLPRSQSRPMRLTSGPISFRSSTASSDGKQIFAVGETPRGELSVFDPKSGLFGKYGSGLSAGFTDFSRDGRWMAYVSHPDGALWRSRIDGSERLQLTFPPMGPILNPQWSPDGHFIVFTEHKDYETNKIYLVSADGGAPLLLLSGDFQPNHPTWSPDGRSLAYGGPSILSGTATEVRILNLDTKQSNTVPGSRRLFSPQWSPDGQFLVAKSADETQLFLYSFQSGAWRQLPSPNPPKGTSVDWQYWSHDSRYLYFMIGLNVYRMRIPEGWVELAASAKSIDIICPVFAWGSWFGLTPDDRVLVLRDRSVQEIYALDLDYR